MQQNSQTKCCSGIRQLILSISLGNAGCCLLLTVITFCVLIEFIGSTRERERFNWPPPLVICRCREWNDEIIWRAIKLICRLSFGHMLLSDVFIYFLLENQWRILNNWNFFLVAPTNKNSFFEKKIKITMNFFSLVQKWEDLHYYNLIFGTTHCRTKTRLCS